MNIEPTAEELAAIREVVGWRESEVYPTADEWRLLDEFLRRVVDAMREPAQVGFGTDGPVDVVVRSWDEPAAGSPE